MQRYECALCGKIIDIENCCLSVCDGHKTYFCPDHCFSKDMWEKVKHSFRNKQGDKINV